MKIGAAALSVCVLVMGSPALAQVDARSFSPAPHAGTMQDPWPGSAITAAINSLPAVGGTVSVADGVWLFDTQQVVPRGSFTLQGASLNARLVFSTGWFAVSTPDGSDLANVVISTLTVDQSDADQNAPQAIQLWSCNSCELSDSLLYGHANGSTAVFNTFGGQDGRILRNKFVSLTQGGSQLQVQAIGSNTNSGFLIDSNELDSCGVLLIGMQNTQVVNNYVHNQTLGDFVTMYFVPTLAPILTQNLVFRNNLVDASFHGGNGAVISGAPQDVGVGGTISNVTIDHNTLRGGPQIGVNSFDPDCLATCEADFSQSYNVAITNNVLEAQDDSQAIINLEGGHNGSVHNVTVTGNIVRHDEPNVIFEDNHDFGVHIGSNSGCTGLQITRNRCRWLKVQHFTN